MGDGGKMERKRKWGARHEYWKWWYSIRRSEESEKKVKEAGAKTSWGINWRKIEAGENGRRREKRACCLIFNRIIFPCLPFIYLILPSYLFICKCWLHAKRETYLSCALHWAHPLTVHSPHTHTSILGDPKEILWTSAALQWACTEAANTIHSTKLYKWAYLYFLCEKTAKWHLVISPHLDYSSTIWLSSSNQDLNKVQQSKQSCPLGCSLLSEAGCTKTEKNPHCNTRHGFIGTLH